MSRRPRVRALDAERVGHTGRWRRAARRALKGAAALAVVAASASRLPALEAGRRAMASAGAEVAPGRAETPRGDTVVQARRGDRLVLQNVAGRVHVRAVEGDRVRVLPSSPGDAVPVGLERSGDRLAVTDRDRRGHSRERDLVLEVPRWLTVDLRANRLEARVEGLRADLSLRNVEGDLDVRDAEGTVSLWSVEGEIRVTDVRGRVDARSVDESVELVRVSGEVRVGSTDGDLLLLDVGASAVEAETVDGDITFVGAVQPGGSYALVTHGGDVTAAVQEGVGARVEVSTFDGSFEAEFPITLERFRGGREMNFTLGDGSARLVLQAFDGDIRLRHRR